MLEEISMLGTHVQAEQPDVEQCILPLVVLFSIAAQENRTGGAARRRTPYGVVPRPVPRALPPNAQFGGPGRAYMAAPRLPARSAMVRRTPTPGIPLRRNLY